MSVSVAVIIPAGKIYLPDTEYNRGWLLLYFLSIRLQELGIDTAPPTKTDTVN